MRGLSSCWSPCCIAKHVFLSTAGGLRDYHQEIQALLSIRSPHFKYTDISVIGEILDSKRALVAEALAKEQDMGEIDDQCRTLRFQQDLLCVRGDEAALVRWFSKRANRDKQMRMLSVSHFSEENAKGMAICKDFMDTNLRVSLAPNLEKGVTSLDPWKNKGIRDGQEPSPSPCC